MTDGIIQGNGNSRYLKSIADFKTLYPTYDDFVNALAAGTLPIDLNGINPDGWRQIGTELNKATLLKDQTAALYGLNRAKITADLSTAAEGDIVKLPEGGKPVEFYVAKRDYEPDLNGTGRVLLVRKDVHSQRQWHHENINAYATSDIDAWLNGEYTGLFPDVVQNAMGETAFYYTPGNGETIVEILNRKAFLLSLTEMGLEGTGTNIEGSAVPIADTLRVFNDAQWLRTPQHTGTIDVVALSGSGSVSYANCTVSNFAFRTAFTLPSDFQYSFYVNEDTGEVFETPDAVPDEALARIGRFNSGLGNEYVWHKTKNETLIRRTETPETGVMIAQTGSSVFTNTMYYADTFTLSSDGTKFVLNNPSSFTYTNATASNASLFNVLKGKYAAINNPTNATIYFFPSTATFTTGGTGWAGTIASQRTKLTDPYFEEVVSDYGYINSPDPNAYPPAVDDGYTYTAFGPLGGKTRCENVTWVGTGATTKLITAPFVPKLMFIQGRQSTGTGLQNGYVGPILYVWDSNVNGAYVPSNVRIVITNKTANSVTFNDNNYLNIYNAQNGYYVATFIG